MPTIISRSGDGERFERSNRTVTIHVDLSELSIHELEFDTTFSVAQHSHDHVDALYVLEGEIEHASDDEIVRAGPGTLVVASAGTPHGFRNLGPGRARVLVFHAPDGGFAEFVRTTRPERQTGPTATP
jgi:quercetin dioxygenase-like cupin family protein